MCVFSLRRYRRDVELIHLELQLQLNQWGAVNQIPVEADPTLFLKQAHTRGVNGSFNNETCMDGATI